MKGLAVFVSAGLASMGMSQYPILYGGGDASEKGYTIGAWGSGSASQSKEAAEGTYSIKIATKGYYIGGMLSFSKPYDVKPAEDDPTYMLVVDMLIPDGSSGGVISSGGPGGPGGKFGAGGVTVGPGGPGPGPGGGNVSNITMRKFRLVIGTDDGKMTEIYFPAYSYNHAGNRWVSYAIPVSKIPNFAQTSSKISFFGFFGDSPETFYIGGISLQQDNTPITGQIVEMNTNYARDDEVLFAVTANAGLSMLRVVWDFDSKNGLQPEAEGAALYRRFRIPGEYTVTATIMDAYGVKKPVSVTTKITVNP